MIRLSALFLATALVGTAAAQTAPPLTSTQSQAVTAAQAFNQCLHKGKNDPVYKAQKKSYDAAASVADQLYAQQREAYTKQMQDFMAAYRHITARDGYEDALKALNEKYEALDRGDSYDAVQAITEMEIASLRKKIDLQVTAETGLTMPADLNRPIITPPEPQDPLLFCKERLNRVLKTLDMHEWAFGSTLADVLATHGPDAYNKMTQAVPQP
ncbi:MAG: hypothetical protein KKA05_05230 [Alphaproteobacteria bacterium]|nr:hypothetical protein [Alphaproteobacteria bacterium]MBU0858512.1 hypothetical protein [Alphaproteobacteria bacterium]